MTDLPTRLILPIDMADRRFVVCEHSGDTFSEDEDYDGLALTLELKSQDEAREVLGALFGDQDTTHEHLADTEARHAHRDLLAVKDAEIERLREILTGVEMLTATSEGLDPEECMTIHLIAAEGRADDPRAWRADPAVIERLRAAVRGEAARDAEIERLTALLDGLADAVEHERNMPCQDMNLQQQAAQAVDDALARIKEPRNGRT